MPSEWTVGRNPDCDIRPGNPSVSRRHMSIRLRDDGQYEINDLGSTGGTHVQKRGRWRRIQRESVVGTTPIKLGDYETSVGVLIGESSIAKAVFVSYASGDNEAALKVAEYLEPRGFSCWIAPRDVRPGHDYGEEIIRGIEAAHSFVLVHSAAANRSAFVKREVERAVSKGKPIFPFRIENVGPSPALELFVSTPQWIDAWSGKLDMHLARLHDILVQNDGKQGATQQVSLPQKKVNRVRAPRQPRRAGRFALVGAGVVVVAALVGAGAVFAPKFLQKETVPTTAATTVSPVPHAPSDQKATAKIATPASAQVVEGVSVALKGMYLSRNQNSIGANLSITNTGEDAALVKVVGRESSFIIPGTVNRAMVQTNGIADCGLADTSSCLKHGLTTWSRLEPGRSYAAFVYSILSTRLSDIGTISSADVNLRLLVRRGNDGKPFDVSFNSVDIGGQK